MAPDTETRVLFVPYRPSRESKQASEGSELSVQKHAAREYHRKAKIVRLEKAYAASKTQHPPPRGKVPCKPPTHESLLETENDDVEEWRDEVSCQTLPGTNAFRIRIAAATSRSPIDVGVGKVDPFNVLIRRDTPQYVQEMLDYGKCSVNSTATCLNRRLPHYLGSWRKLIPFNSGVIPMARLLLLRRGWSNKRDQAHCASQRHEISGRILHDCFRRRSSQCVCSHRHGDHERK